MLKNKLGLKSQSALAEAEERISKAKAKKLFESGFLHSLKAGSFDQIVEKYVEMNVAYPFAEGNGRSMRIWLDLMLKSELGVVVEWSKISREDYLLAMERSPIKDTELKLLLQGALSDEVESESVFM